METSLEKYIVVTKNVLSKEACKNHVNELSILNWKKHSSLDYEKNEYVSLDDDLEILAQSAKCNDLIIPNLWNPISAYYKGLDFSWFSIWGGYTSLKFNRYRPGQTMHTHFDNIRGIYDNDKNPVLPILSVVGVLNDDYVGGEFIMFDDMEIKLEAGDVMIFPSNFLYPHKVKHVTDGVRYSYVSWVW